MHEIALPDIFPDFQLEFRYLNTVSRLSKDDSLNIIIFIVIPTSNWNTFTGYFDTKTQYKSWSIMYLFIIQVITKVKVLCFGFCHINIHMEMEL